MMRSQSFSWDSLVIEDLGHSLRVEFVGGRQLPTDDPCYVDYEVEVKETEASVTLTLWELFPATPVEGSDCITVGLDWHLDVTPDAVLGDRTVIDGHDGSSPTVIDDTAVLAPTWLPDGYVERDRSFDGPALTVAYGPDDDSPPALKLLVARTDNGIYHMDGVKDWAGTDAEDIGIRGKETGAVKSRSLDDDAVTIVLEHGGRHYRATALASVSEDVLIRFVDELD